MGTLQPVVQPLTIPGYMPLKSADSVVKKYSNYLNEDNIGRLAAKLARFTYFGECVLAKSSIAGGSGKHPLNPTVLMEVRKESISNGIAYRI